MGNLVHAVMAVGAEELQPQLESADVILDLFGQRARRIELRQVEREINRVAHGANDLFSSSTTGSATGGGGVEVIAAVLAAFSSEVIRR